MTIATPGPSPIDDSLPAVRSKRISELTRIVFDFSRERSISRWMNLPYDEAAPSDLLAALKACSYYFMPTGAHTISNLKTVFLEGADKNNYLVEFAIRDPSIAIHAARINLASLSLDPSPDPLRGPGFKMREIEVVDVFDILPDVSFRLQLQDVAVDRAFLIGMSLVIGFMDDQDDDLDEDARLAPLLALTMPTTDELRKIRAKLPPSSFNFEEEGDMPY